MSYVLFSLVGDFSKVAEEIERELKKRDTDSEEINDMSVNKLKESLKTLEKENVTQAQTILNLRRELNEVYDKHKAIYAELGEINYFLREAFKVSTRNFSENGK